MNMKRILLAAILSPLLWASASAEVPLPASKPEPPAKKVRTTVIKPSLLPFVPTRFEKCRIFNLKYRLLNNYLIQVSGKGTYYYQRLKVSIPIVCFDIAGQPTRIILPGREI